MDAILNDDLITIYKELGIASLICIVYLLFIGLWGPRDDVGPDKSPRYTWWCSLTIQLIVFPTLCAYAFYTKMDTQDFSTWLLAPWDEGPRSTTYLEARLWFYAFFGYMAKDMVGIFGLGGMYWIHHFVCIGLCFNFLFGSLPPGIFIMGATFAEFGSGSMGLYALELGYDTWYISYLYIVNMTISNTGVVYLLIPLTQALWDSNPVAIGLIDFTVFSLMFKRQEFALAELQDMKKRFAKEKTF
jgi:hypothetical protein